MPFSASSTSGHENWFAMGSSYPVSIGRTRAEGRRRRRTTKGFPRDARREKGAVLAARGDPRRNGSPCRFYMGPLRGFIAVHDGRAVARRRSRLKSRKKKKKEKMKTRAFYSTWDKILHGDVNVVPPRRVIKVKRVRGNCRLLHSLVIDVHRKLLFRRIGWRALLSPVSGIRKSPRIPFGFSIFNGLQRPSSWIDPPIPSPRRWKHESALSIPSDRFI